MASVEDAVERNEIRYVSLSHIIDPVDTEDGGFSVYTVPTGTTINFPPDEAGVANLYRQVFGALQGKPKTKTEVLEEIGAEENQKDLATQIIDALEDMTAIAATNGLVRATLPLWRNPPVYPAVGIAPNQPIPHGQSYKLHDGEAVIPFDVRPSFERVSTRDFDPKQPLDFIDLQHILVNSYRTSPDTKRPTPSPGGIYPVTIHIINANERISDTANGKTLANGIYQYDPEQLALIRTSSSDAESANRAIEFMTDDPDAGEPAAWIVLGVDTEAFTEKYGNASIPFTTLTIGSVMQRIIEESEAQGYGTLPFFRINHAYADKLLQNPAGHSTVLAIALGKQDETGTSHSRSLQLEAQLAKAKVGIDGFIFNPSRLPTGHEHGALVCSDFAGAAVAYNQLMDDGKSEESHTFGTASTYAEAQLKAIAEAIERMSSANLRVDRRASAHELDAPWLDPEILLPLDDWQQARTKTQRFSPDTPLDWTGGTSLRDGKTVYAPSSHVYYPTLDLEHSVGLTCSSGVAAHFDKEQAVQRAFMELIERNAIMRTWILQKTPPHVPLDTLSPALQRRTEQMAVGGRTVDILDITQDDAVPVYLVTIRGDEFPYFYSGASASLDPERAIHKALDEAVLGMTTRLVNEEHLRKDEARKNAQGLFDTDSHGMLYASNPEAVASLGWLYGGPAASLPSPESIPNMEALIERYEPVAFDLDNPIPENELKVVRVIAYDLIPIMFGDIGVPYLARSLPKGTKQPERPHFFD